MNLPINDLAGLAWSQIWQVTVLATFVGVVTRLFCRRRPHLAYMLWMLVLLKCLTPPVWSSPTGCFSWAQFRVMPVKAEVRSSEADVAVADSDDRAVAAPVFHGPRHIDLHLDPSPATAPAMPVASIAADAPRVLWRDHVSIRGITAVVWLIGALAFAGLLQRKWSSYRRKLKCSTVPVDAAIELLAVQLGERLGLRRKFRVVVTTESIGPAVFGLLRPTVVLPQSVVAGKTLQQIEPILAHELVHFRRGDTYCGAMQLAVEVLWWFHPLVWWANRTMCHERERCCDEEVVAGLKYRPAAYARCLLDVLDSERNWRPMLAVPGVRFMEVTQKRLEDIMNRSNRFHAKTPRWSWALLIVAAVLVLPGGAIILGEDAASTATKKAKVTENTSNVDNGKAIAAASGRAPSLAEIAKANDAAWAAIRSLDVEYTLVGRETQKGSPPREDHASGRWMKAGKHERLQQRSREQSDFEDFVLDGATARHARFSGGAEKHRDGAVADPDQVGGEIYVDEPRWFARGNSVTKPPELLRYFPMRHGSHDAPPTLCEIIATWKVSLTGKVTTASGETLWRLHAQYRPKDGHDDLAGSYIDIGVNADKGFLVQKAVFHEAKAVWPGPDHKTPIDFRRCVEVKKFQKSQSGLWFPACIECRQTEGGRHASAEYVQSETYTITKLSLNSPPAKDAFDFRLPKGARMFVNNKHDNNWKLLIWGDNNKPVKEFSRAEYEKLESDMYLEETRKKVEKNLASKKPHDLCERGYYYMETRRYDEAVAAFSQCIAAALEPQEKANALMCRGMAYLVKQDSGKAAADLTEAIHLVEKPDKKGESPVCADFYVFRGLAYASQDETLDKALADLSKVRMESVEFSDPDDPESGCSWIPLLRAAIRIRRLNLNIAGQNQAETPTQLGKSVSDDLQAALNHGCVDAYAVVAYLSDKGGDHAGAEKFRQAAQAAKSTTEKLVPRDDFGADVKALFHKCLVRLLPEIEKK